MLRFKLRAGESCLAFDDIHILSLCELMPGACARILETSPPPRRADSAETTT